MPSSLFRQLGSVVQNAIMLEKSERLNADAFLQNSLQTETTARQSDVTSVINGLSAETTNRQNADATLTANLSTEISARQTAVTTLTTNLDAEVSARQTAVATKVTSNAAITAGTGTKVTYDTKGLVTSSTSAASTDLSDTAVIVRKATVNTVPNTISDGIGDLRSVAVTTKSAAYTLVAADNGTCISTNSGVTVPANTFAAGNTIVIFNNSGAAITITASAVTSYITGTDATKSSVSLATRGMCTIFFYGLNTIAVSGDVA